MLLVRSNKVTNDDLRKLTLTPQYYTSDHASIYINNILIDECFDIQYSYRELIEPVYGYRDKHYNSVLRGAVAIHGQFTINYVHDSYMSTIASFDADKINTINGSITNTNGSVIDTLPSKNQYKSILEAYKEFLKQYREKMATKSNLEAEKAVLEQTGKDLLTLKTLMEKKKEDAEKQSGKEQDKLVNNTSPERYKEAEGYYTQGKDGLNNYEQNKQFLETLVLDSTTNQNQINSQFKIPPIITDITSKEIILNQQYEYAKEDAKDAGKTDDENVLKYYIIRLRNYNNDTIKSESEKRLKKSTTADWYKNPLSWFNDDTEQYGKIANALDISKLKYDEEIKKIEVDITENNKAKETNKLELDKLKDLESKLAEYREKLEDVGDNYPLEVSNNGGSNEITGGMSTYVRNIAKKDGNRFEDLESFDIVFKYNNNQHKKLTTCYATGHTHYVGVGGETIKEVYTFIARKLE